MRIAEKRKITENLRSKFIESTSVILTDYKGLDVESINLLRRRLREVGVEFQVAKNSLLVRASVGNSVDLIKEKFRGPSAVALCYGDPVAPAKIITDFVLENKALEVKGAVLGDKLISKDEVRILALLPSRDVLLARLLSSVNAVPISLLTLLSGVVSSFLNVLQAIKDQRDV